MADDINNLIATVTESQLWAHLRAKYDAAGTAWRSWSTRNAFMVVSRFVTLAESENRAAIQEIAKGMFLQFASGLALRYFAKSQYQLEQQLATFCTGRFVIDIAGSVSSIPVSAGQMRAGTPGAITDKSRLFTSTQAATLYAGEANVMEFSADGAGDSYNLPVGAPVDLKTSLPGATASLRASGAGTMVGSSTASLLFYAADAGVTVEIIDPGTANHALQVAGNLATSVITITLATDAASALTATASAVRRAVAQAIPIGALAVGPFLVACALGGDGTGIVQPTASPVPLEWTGTWISSYGQNDQSEASLKEDCANRFPTMGGAGGDGAPVSDAQTDNALAFWAKRPPVGYKTSPVTRLRVYSNLDDTGAVDGAAVLIVVAGAAGPLSSDDVLAVSLNFERPKKYSYGTTLRVRSAVTNTVALVGVVSVLRSSGRTLAEVETSVAAAVAAYRASPQLDIGAVIQPSKLLAVVVDADRNAIDSYVPSAPAAPVALAFNEDPVFDLTGLTFVYV